jgi:hypothetical protein
VDAITIDGQPKERSWRSAFRSPVFSDARGKTSPYTELRATADEETLYLEIYVADVDIESAGDKVQVEVGPLQVVVTPKGGSGPPGVRVATDTDDTIDKSDDLDEEWVSEVAIPWNLLHSHAVRVRAFRIDVGHGEPPHALAWPPKAAALLLFGGGGGVNPGHPQ